MQHLIHKYHSFHLAIVIPFFNEENRIAVDSFTHFIKETNFILLVLVDDGSTDKTHEVLKEIQNQSPGSVEIIKLDKNIGKGNAIRAGMEMAIETKIPFTAYMDADLSAPFEEIIKLYSFTRAHQLDAVFGSRLKKLGSNIQRSLFRHLSGRLIATIIDTKFKIGCYDTQCSAKVFSTAILPDIIETPFYTRWFFDVEIMLRLKKKDNHFNIQEVPLENWEHKPGSKITALSFFNILKELVKLFNKY